MCTISHNTDGERECHKLKFKGNFKNCLIKCANTVSKELIFHILDEHTQQKPIASTLLKVNCNVFKQTNLNDQKQCSMTKLDKKPFIFQWGGEILDKSLLLILQFCLTKVKEKHFQANQRHPVNQIRIEHKESPEYCIH